MCGSEYKGRTNSKYCGAVCRLEANRQYVKQYKEEHKEELKIYHRNYQRGYNKLVLKTQIAKEK